MKQYLELLNDVIHNGHDKSDRTGTGTRSLFGRQLRFDLRQGFPLITTKKLHFKSVVGELLWFLRGETNVKWLQDNGIKIWDEWADPKGELGPIYGAQWRAWNRGWGMTVDQFAGVIKSLNENPNSRRHIVSAWNVGEIGNMALPPCHILFQFYVVDGTLSCHMYQRSADIFLGLPFNIASYALLTHLVAREVGLYPADLIISLGDVHLYSNHFEQAHEQLKREPKSLPSLALSKGTWHLLDGSLTFDDIILRNYDAHPHIKAQVAV